MSFKIVKLDKNRDYEKWNRFLKDADGKTIFHSLDFLSYHKDRFNEHHLGVIKGEELVGIIPLAIENKIASSPYGASYGGFLFKKTQTYSNSKKIVKAFIEYLKDLDVKEIYIRPSIGIYYEKEYSQTFLFAMLEEGFKVINSDITSVVDLTKDTLFTSRARNMARKALKYGVKIKFRSNLDDFWLLMEKTYARHQKNPTHTKEEYRYLMQKLPENIYCHVAYIDDIPIAGIGVFELNRSNIMSFYLCKDESYKHLQGQTLLIRDTILDAKERGFKYFDFGTSSTNMIGSESVFKFKESFGAIGLFRETYHWSLK